MEYPINRYTMETKRLLDVLDRRLAENPYLAGGVYTIANIAAWPWYGALMLGRLYDASEFLDVQSYKNVQRWTAEIDARPAARRARMVNRTWGNPAEQLLERHLKSDFELRTQDKIGDNPG
jgi:GST-like protein